MQQESLGDRVAHELRVLVVSGALAPGTHLVEGALAERFDVSRGPVRDALRVLEAEGLIESRRKGMYVTGLAAADVDELYSLRESLESLALRLAMAAASEVDWAAARDRVAEMRDAAQRADPPGFARSDLAFHTEFYILSRHRRLTAVWDQYRPTFAVMLDITNAQDRDLRPAAESHADLLDAAVAGNIEAAVTILSQHLRGSCDRLRGALHLAEPRPRH